MHGQVAEAPPRPRPLPRLRVQRAGPLCVDPWKHPQVMVHQHSKLCYIQVLHILSVHLAHAEGLGGVPAVECVQANPVLVRQENRAVFATIPPQGFKERNVLGHALVGIRDPPFEDWVEPVHIGEAVSPDPAVHNGIIARLARHPGPCRRVAESELSDGRVEDMPRRQGNHVGAATLHPSYHRGEVRRRVDIVVVEVRDIIAHGYLLADVSLRADGQVAPRRYLKTQEHEPVVLAIQGTEQLGRPVPVGLDYYQFLLLPCLAGEAAPDLHVEVLPLLRGRDHHRHLSLARKAALRRGARRRRLPLAPLRTKHDLPSLASSMLVLLRMQRSPAPEP
mmetsp:Transcript_99629/g.277410  ORF Transcript_99629/g.277410 Transcript_99629/m.277410 type:complete len:335 (-) Transcript_99629:215-1219(-)